jgi:hypothetical protein
MRGNLGLLSQLIAEGQQEGSIRSGDPFLMALSVGAQPLFLSLMQQALREGTALDQGDAETRRQLVESVVEFVRGGLAAEAGGSD